MRPEVRAFGRCADDRAGPTVMSWSASSTCSRSASARRARTPSVRCGPPTASRDLLEERGRARPGRGVHVELFGSLGATGRGHGTPDAVVLGLEGPVRRPSTPSTPRGVAGEIRDDGKALLAGRQPVALDADAIVLLPRDAMPAPPQRAAVHRHRRRRRGPRGEDVLLDRRRLRLAEGEPERGRRAVPHPFDTAEELLSAARDGSGIAELRAGQRASPAPDAEVARGARPHLGRCASASRAGCRADGDASRRPAASSAGPRALQRHLDRARRAPATRARAMDWLTFASPSTRRTPPAAAS